MKRRLSGAAVLLLLAITIAGTRFMLPVAAQADPVTVRLAERNDSGISGQVALTATEGATWVEIEIEGSSDTLLPYLHRGTCTMFRDAPAIPLSLTAGSPSKTAVDLPMDKLTAGGYVIDLHVVGGDIDDLLDPATSVACGEIGTVSVAVDGAAGTTQPPVTGIGPIQSGRDWMLAMASVLAMMSLALAVTCVRTRPQPVEAPVIINVVALHRLRGLTK